MMGPVAVTTEPSGALSVNQTGDDVWAYPIAGTVKESTTKRAAKSLRTLNLPFSMSYHQRKGRMLQAFNTLKLARKDFQKLVGRSLLSRGESLQAIRIHVMFGESGLKGACFVRSFPDDIVLLSGKNKITTWRQIQWLVAGVFFGGAPIAGWLTNLCDCGCRMRTGDWFWAVRTNVVRSLENE
jgi:hypothetical protein